MTASAIDQEALVKLFAKATSSQGEALRNTVRETTLKALQQRELTLVNIRKTLGAVTQAVSTGTAQSDASPASVEKFLGEAFSGMDAALLQAVQAQRKALEQFVEQGVRVENEQMSAALKGLESMEETFFNAVTTAARQGDDALQKQWQQVLAKVGGTNTGEQSRVSLEQLMDQARKVVRDGRSSGMQSARIMMDSYATLVSGVLIGMSEGLQSASPGRSAGK